MTITILQLNGTEYAEPWIRTVFNEPSCFEALSDDSRSSGFVFELVDRCRCNQVIALMPVVDGVAAGLYWGGPWEGGIYSVHEFMMPRFRKGFIPIKAARACAAKAFSISAGIEYLMGIVPVTYRAALLTGKRAGWKQIGIFPGFHLYHGERIDCAIMMKGRDNG